MLRRAYCVLVEIEWLIVAYMTFAVAAVVAGVVIVHVAVVVLVKTMGLAAVPAITKELEAVCVEAAVN